MSWKPGLPVTITSTNIAQKLSPASAFLVKAVRVFSPPTAGHTIYVGDSTLDPTTGPITGMLGWIPATPAGPTFYPYLEGYEAQSMNGIDTGLLYVAGTSGDFVHWSYIEQ